MIRQRLNAELGVGYFDGKEVEIGGSIEYASHNAGCEVDECDGYPHEGEDEGL